MSLLNQPKVPVTNTIMLIEEPFSDMLILQYTSFTSHNNNKDPGTLSNSGRFSQQQCCKLRSQLRYLSLLNSIVLWMLKNMKMGSQHYSITRLTILHHVVKEDRRELGTAGENIYSLCSKTLVLIAQFSPSFAVLQKD